MTINVFLVDDSATVRAVLKMILEKDPDITVLGVAASADIALKKMAKQWPDVIISDLEMPGMHGLDFLKYIREHRPTPFVVCSSHVGPGAKASIDALALGAVEIISKPNIGVEAYLGEITATITEAIKAAAAAGIRHIPEPVRRPLPPIMQATTAPPPAAPASALPSTTPFTTPSPTAPIMRRPPAVIAVGSSTGGTTVVEHLLKHMTADMPSVLIVQHMPKHFTELFAKRLNSICAIEVKEAEDGDAVMPGRALIAPGGQQMKLAGQGDQLYVRIVDEPPVNRHRPSVDVLFHSVANTAGAKAIGVILTGMGEDGAAGLLAMRRSGALTIGQDQASSAVYGMPRAAMENGAVAYQLSDQTMPDFIRQCLSNTQHNAPHKVQQ